MFRVTSIRKGFAGGGFDGSRSLPKQMAMAAGVPAPISSPRRRSSSSASRPPRRPASARRRSPTSRRSATSTSAPASTSSTERTCTCPAFEDLEAWYLNFDHRERVDTTFRPGLDVPVQTLTVRRARTTSRRRPTSRPTARPAADRPQRRHPAVLEAHGGPERAGRDALQEGHGDPAPRRLQHARQPVLLDGASRARPLRPRARSRPALRRLQPVATTSGATGWRWTASSPTGRCCPFEPRSTRAGLQRRQTTHRQNFLCRRAPAARSHGRVASLVRRMGMVRHARPAVALDRQLAALVRAP